MLAGLYGLEVRQDGTRRDHPDAGTWRDVVTDVVQAAHTGPDGMRVESKGLSITLHYRGRPELEPEVVAWAEHQSARSGLVVRPAKMSVELIAPIAMEDGQRFAIREGGLTVGAGVITKIIA